MIDIAAGPHSEIHDVFSFKPFADLAYFKQWK